MADPDQETIEEFLVESREGLEQLERDLVALEGQPGNDEILSRIFRTLHTIKGSSSFAGFSRLESIAHSAEHVLNRLRDGHLRLDAEITEVLLRAVDAIQEILRCIEETQTEGETKDLDALIALLNQVSGSAPDALDRSASAASVGAEEATSTPGIKDKANGATSDNSIRVNIELLDKLMNLVGELVLARNQIVQFTSDTSDAGLVTTCQRLNLITSELQAGIMKARMQPINNIWGRFPRIVRDLAKECGKKVRLEIKGKETELDRGLLEAVKDPLTHLVRNALDHGIEAPERRKERGKAEEGLLVLRAFHEGGQVNIEISDDGQGIDRERIKEKALRKGLVTAERAAQMSAREAVDLVYLPGFSSAEEVTTVSGRGVGMDVVKTNVEKFGGSVDLDSTPGRGTRVMIRIPLTLAIIPALIVRSGQERFAIPQIALVELVRLEGESARNGIEMMHGVPVCRLRGRLLPVVDLGLELQLGSEHAGTDKGTGEDDEQVLNIAVLQADQRQFGLVVDEIRDTQEIVVKPVPKQIKALTVYSGSTILSDGQVALILDVVGLAQQANVVSERTGRALVNDEAHEASREDGGQQLLLFSLHDDERMAIPLSMVARLEEFPRSAIEQAGAREVVQYRDQILRLFDVATMLPERRKSARTARPEAEQVRETVQVVVCRIQERDVGLMIGRILDTVEEKLTVKDSASREGVLFNAIIKERVTEMLDVPAMIRGADPSFFNQMPVGSS
ncbi:MAG: chemotaxis protein CheW [Proteobacteria bacterium]|nr:chemotaxis protein CheW [Pseudomonadota bacterium]